MRRRRTTCATEGSLASSGMVSFELRPQSGGKVSAMHNDSEQIVSNICYIFPHGRYRTGSNAFKIQLNVHMSPSFFVIFFLILFGREPTLLKNSHDVSLFRGNILLVLRKSFMPHVRVTLWVEKAVG
jgi:hypothetical protein